MNWKFWKKKEKSVPEKKKSAVREWTDAIVFAVVAATLIRWLIMEAYTIPTPSMENSLLVGDFLFVSKFHYGTRTPRTPLQIPLTHQKIWFTNIPSYIDAVQLPSYRLPGFTSIKRNDVVVFNVPPRSLNEGKDYPVDLKTNYIKRCVAAAGEVLEIRGGEVVVNGEVQPAPPKMQQPYIAITKDQINPRNFEKIGLDPEDYNYRGRDDEKAQYMMYLTPEKAAAVEQQPWIVSFMRDASEPGAWEPDIYPRSPYTRWNRDHYGPLRIPAKGMTIPVNDSTLAIYGETIRLYDLNESVEIKDGKLRINGQEVNEYTFQQNYYFMMGDNRGNSWDSRYWGFVPEDHVVGKAFFIWLSIDKHGSFFHKIRWSRFFNLIR